MYFIGFAPAQERIRVLEPNLEKFRCTLDTLEIIHQQSTGIETPPRLEDVQRSQPFALDYGSTWSASRSVH